MGRHNQKQLRLRLRKRNAERTRRMPFSLPPSKFWNWILRPSCRIATMVLIGLLTLHQLASGGALKRHSIFWDSEQQEQLLRSSFTQSSSSNNKRREEKRREQTTASRTAGTSSSPAPVVVLARDIFQDIDWDQIPSCGFKKCFFRSGNDPSLGYLIEQKATRKESQKAYDFAIDLEKNFTVRHFMKDPPIQWNSTDMNESEYQSWIDHLNRRISIQSFDDVLKSRSLAAKRLMDKGNKFEAAYPITVQSSVVAPDPYLLFGCVAVKRKSAEHFRTSFVRRVPDPQSFARILPRELSALMKMMKHHECLFFDFQMVLDTTGKIYQIDLDRCWNQMRIWSDKIDFCKVSLERFVNETVQMVLNQNKTT